jgi:Cft2 family RNA processing exonuclease
VDKKCNVCNDTLLIEKFYKDKASPDGYMRKCIKCTLEIRKKNSDKPKIIVTEKKCTCCNTVKYISEYYKRKVSADGYSIYCKECAKSKAASVYEVHGDKYMATKKKKRELTKEKAMNENI